MSLDNDGAWKGHVWSPTAWANAAWVEGIGLSVPEGIGLSPKRPPVDFVFSTGVLSFPSYLKPQLKLRQESDALQEMIEIYKLWKSA